MAEVLKRDFFPEIPLDGMRVGIAIDGGPFRDVIGASLIQHTSGTRSSSQVHTFRGSTTVLGAKPIEGVGISLASVDPTLPIMQDIARADRLQQAIRCRADVYPQFERKRVAASATLQVAAGKFPASDDAPGVERGASLTIAAAGSETVPDIQELFLEDWRAGYFISIGADDSDANTYRLAWVGVDEDSGAFMTARIVKLDGSRVSAPIGAGTFSVRRQGVRLDFSGKISQSGSFGGDISGDPNFSGELTVVPKSVLSDTAWRPLTATEGAAGW